MNILGVNCFSHDTAACLLIDGKLIAFVEEERLNRDKHTKQFPTMAIDYCLEAGGLSPGDIDYVALAHRPGLDFKRAMADILRRLPGSYRRLFYQPAIDLNLYLKKPYVRRRVKAPVVFVGHHEAHLAASFFCSPFEEAAVMSIDRGGDYISTVLAHGKGSNIEVVDTVYQPHSIGEIYTAVTQHLGFLPNCDEGKVMGLAPYGGPSLSEAFGKLIHMDDGGTRFTVDLDYFTYHQKSKRWCSPKFEAEFGSARTPGSELDSRHEDLAWAVQNLTEKSALHLAGALGAATGSRNLCLAGGVALNSVMNAKLLIDGPFDNIFIQPAAGDAGNALGAALWMWHVVLANSERRELVHAFWGPEYSSDQIAAAASARGLPHSTTANPAAWAAQRLAAGKIVGWFQGRAEVGPRALGNRSILANPCIAEMKDIVNKKVKFREPFRPFAPAVLAEYGHEYFDNYYPTPFMLLVLGIKSSKQSVIPAVCHVDGTGRLQTVDKNSNPHFWPVIDEFRKLTGVPVLMNTSFNVQGEPIVLTPENAVNTFLKSNMDCLVMGDVVVDGKEGA